MSSKNVTDYVEAGVTGICLGSAYLGGLLAEKGKKRFVKEMEQFVSLVAKARGKKSTARKSQS